MTERQRVLQGRIKLLLGFVALGLFLSGVTAFPLQRELDLMTGWMGVPSTAQPDAYSGLTAWLVTVRNGLRSMYADYPWIAYGTDWLAFAHVMLAILFLGALRDPVRNLWVIHFGLIACVGVIFLAMICGPIRGIPFLWRLIDCSFGVLGSIPLLLAREFALELAALRADAAT